MKRLDRTEIIFKILSYSLLTIFALCCLYPFIYVLSASLSSRAAVDSGKVVLIPVEFSVDTYVAVFNNKEFWISYSNTFFVTGYGTLVSMLVAITGAYALSKSRLVFGRGFNFMLVFTMWFSAGMIPTFQNFKLFHVDNKYMFIIALGFNAFNIILLRNYFSSVPTEIEEAATIDGATEFQILTKIYIPMSKSSIVTVAMFYAVARWNGYIWAQMLLLKSEDVLLTVFIKNSMAQLVDQINNGADAAYSVYGLQYAFIVCSIIPVIVVYPALQKYFAAGVNVGGVKE
ncbi:MAG: carbohydrate ABC transporter permease [Acholeplasmatales bacterium]|jgi:putative aldouronate transport system permease protein|nr:carbohydrate ABC transporter permease [Acholeplasmatales bacterium]